MGESEGGLFYCVPPITDFSNVQCVGARVPVPMGHFDPLAGWLW